MIYYGSMSRCEQGKRHLLLLASLLLGGCSAPAVTSDTGIAIATPSIAAPLPITPSPELLRSSGIRHSRLCVRVENENDVAEAVRMGATHVRVWMSRDQMGNADTSQERALHMAVNAYGMTPIFVFTETAESSLDPHTDDLGYMLTKFPTAIIEILNEWDNEYPRYWPDRDVVTAAAFAANTIRFIKQKDIELGYPERRIILGATIDPANLEPMLYQLRDVQGVEVTRLLIASHSYNSVEDVWATSATTLDIMSRYGIPPGHHIITELGASGENQRNLPNLMDQGLYGPYSAAGICLHTLSVHESANDTEKSFAMSADTIQAVIGFAVQNAGR